MVELRLHLDLYAADAIAEAVRIFAPHGELAVVDEAPYRVVRVSASSPERERAIAGELGNFAFGLTVNAPDGDDAEAPSKAEEPGAGDASTNGPAPTETPTAGPDDAAQAPGSGDEEVEP